MPTATAFHADGRIMITTTSEPYPRNFIPALLADTWKRFERGEKPPQVGLEGFPIYADHPLHAEHLLLDAYFRDTQKLVGSQVKLEKFLSSREILTLDEAGKARFILAALERLPWFWKTGIQQVKSGLFGKTWQYSPPLWRENVKPLFNALLRSGPPFTEPQFISVVTAILEPPDYELLQLIRPKTVIRLAKELWPGGVPASVLGALGNLEKVLKKRNWGTTAEERKVMTDLAVFHGKPRPPVVIAGEAWSDAALGELNQMPAAEREPWLTLLEHCGGADGSKPTKKWLKEAGEWLEKIGRQNFKARVIRWFDLVAQPRTVHQEPRSQHLPDPNWLIVEKNATVLRGLAWCCAGWADAETSAALAGLAEVCFKKIRWLGARCPRAGNGCLYSLSATPAEDAAAQLSRLDSTVKQPTAKKRIGKSLDAAATLTGQTRADLEEKSVPAFGLGTEGKIKQNFENHFAELVVVDGRDVEIHWHQNDGKPLKSVPSQVKQQQPAELKQLQKQAKAIQKMLAAQRIRIERLLMTGREWDFEAWRHRYSEQPLLAPIVRRLVWHFRTGDKSGLAAWLDGKLVDIHSQPLDWLEPQTRVRLWHPTGFPVETVAAWRQWLERHQICQPFKQAHREIYILTDAELQTATYSNRFAAHIIGQHQFAALAGQRGWKYSFMGGFDSYSTPTLELPAWDLTVEFWVEATSELADSGVSRFLATDQVRFLRNNEPIPLSEVPAPVFTEVMRDVDLFVGVCSIGNDPTWSDGGPDGQYRNYWQDYSFGDLSASARTRRDVLDRLLPKLKIAGQCELQEKFLAVNGSLRRYKIHLGSGNILMEPNDQYLCIVPQQGGASAKTDKVFLPFEGDRTLSIILSKAFLLADDSKIKDPVIVNQIRRR